MPTTIPSRASAVKADKRIKTLEAAVAQLAGAVDVVVTDLEKTQTGPAAYRRALKAFLRKQLEKAKVAKAKPSFGTKLFTLSVKQGMKKELISGDRVAQVSPARPGLNIFSTPKAVKPAAKPLAAAQARGEAAKVEWVRSGEVVPAKELADKWDLTPQALGPAEKRGELFSVVVKRHRYYPREFLTLNRDDVGTVCKQLEPLDATEKLLFWKRPHGALGGKTVSALLSDSKKAGPQLVRVAQLAQSWSSQARAHAATRA